MDQKQIDHWMKIYRACVEQPLVEVFHGVKSNSIDWLTCLSIGVGLNVACILGLDRMLFKKMHLDLLLPPAKLWWHFGYAVILSLSGFYLWGAYQAILHFRVMRRLTGAFRNSGLKNAIGQLPSYVFDRPLDDASRKLRLTRAHLPLSQFQSAKPALESALQIYIDEIVENREQGTVDIVYASMPMPSSVKIESFGGISKDQFFVGENRSRKVYFDINETPHLLIGGQSGGGKSTFLRQLITTLYLNNESYRFTLIDLKGGLEFQIFENLKRIKTIPSTARALASLQTLEEELVKRMEVFKTAKCKDISSYLELPREDRVAFEEKTHKNSPISRHIVVIDEAAELFLAGDKTKSGNAQKAKAHAIKIAAQGRAVGVHLVVATQRPDVRAVDGQIKANLSGALSFQMPNHASSMTILDNTRAAHLPKVPGRAIWKTGLDMIELQTPFVSVDEVNKVLEPFRVVSEESKDE